MHYKQSNQYFFRTKSNSESVCFTLMTSLTMTSFSMTRADFVNYNMPKIVDNNISYLKLTIYRQLVCWILIAHHLNINKNIPHRPEVQRLGAPKSPNVTLPAQACLNEVCYKMEMLRNAAEIVGRFCAKLNAFHCVF